MHTQPIPMNQAYKQTDKVIPFPGNTDNPAKQATATALWTAFDSGVFAALRDIRYGPACQSVYTALIRRLPNVHPGLTRLASDVGVSRVTVIRVLAILESIGLITRHRSDTDAGDADTTVYQLADLRDQEVAKRCHALIRKLMKTQTPSSSKGGRCADAPTSSPRGGCVHAPTGRCAGATGVGAPTHPKDTNKKQSKQQEASPRFGGGDLDDLREEILGALRRWGITGPDHLLDPAKRSAIPELIQRPHEAVQLIDKAMSLRPWTSDCGGGLRVNHLRSHIRKAIRLLEADKQDQEKRHRQFLAQARAVIGQLPACEVSGVDELLPDRQEELFKRGLDALSQPDDVIALIAADPSARHRIVASELEKERLGSNLDAMGDEDLDQLKQELLEREPGLRRLFRKVDPRSIIIRGTLIEQLRLRRSNRIGETASCMGE